MTNKAFHFQDIQTIFMRDNDLPSPPFLKKLIYRFLKSQTKMNDTN